MREKGTTKGSEASHSQAVGDLGAEIERVGKRQVLAGIRVAARRALTDFPDLEEADLGPGVRAYLSTVDDLLTKAIAAPKWSDVELVAYAGQVAGVKVATDMMVAYLTRDQNGGGGGGGTCAGKCLTEYDTCMKEHSCVDDSWICICCVPCSIQYMGCLAKCALPSRGFGGMVMF